MKNYLSLLDSIEELAVIKLDKNFIVRYCNSGVPKITGYSITELIGENINFIFKEIGSDRLLAIADAEFENSPNEGWIYKKGGTRFWGAIKLKDLGEIDEPGYALTISDITEKRIFEDQLMFQKATFESMLSNAVESFILTDINGTILNYNENARSRKSSGTKTTLVSGKNIVDVIARHGKEELEGFISRALNGESVCFEKNIIDLDGSSHWFDYQVFPVKNETGVIALCFKGYDITEKKLAILSVGHEERKFQAIVENGSDMVFILSEINKVIYASPSVHRLWGYTEEEIMKCDLFSLFHPDSVLDAIESYQRVMANPGIPIRCKNGRFKHKNGTWRWYEATVTNLLHDPAVNGIVDNFRDITVQVLKDEAILENRQQLRKIMENSLDVICTTDRYGILKIVSSSSQGIWGYPPREIVGSSMFDLVYEEDKSSTYAELNKIVNGNHSVDFENRTLKKDGSLVPMMWSARWNEQEETLFAIGRDITEKKKLEVKLALEQKRFIDLFELAPTMICILKGDRHIFEMANPTYLQVTGKSNIIGKTVKDVFPEIEDQGFIDLLNNVYRSGEPYMGKESLIRLNVNGNDELKDVYLDFVYQPYKNEEGKTEGIFVIANFITEQVEARKKTEQKEKYFRTLVENAGDMFILLTKKSEFIYVSPAFERATGYSREEVIGKSLFTIVLPEFVGDTSNFFSIILSNPGTPIRRTNALIKKNGGIVWVEGWVTNLLKDENVQAVAGNLYDITDRKLGELKLINVNRLYAFISNINKAIVHITEPAILFREACRIAVEVGKFKMAWIGLKNTKTGKICFEEGAGMDKADIELLTGESYTSSGTQENVVKSGVSFVCNDLEKDIFYSGWKVYASSRCIKSFMVLAIRKAGTIIGSFNLYSGSLNLFDDEEKNLLEEIVGDISFSLDVFEKDRLRQILDEKLKHSERRLQQAQSVAHIGSWELDLGTMKILGSEEACRIYGIPPHENPFDFKIWHTAVHPDDLEKGWEIFTESKKDVKNFSFHHRIILPSGEVRHIYLRAHFELNSIGAPIKVYGVSHDITEAYEVEAALAQSEANLRLIVDLIPQPIFVRDIEGKFLFVNKCFVTLYGLDPDDIINRSILDTYPDQEQAGKFLMHDLELFENGRTSSINEVSFRDKTGEIHLLSVLKVPFYPVRSSKKALLIVATDVTQQRKAEGERLKMISDIVQRNKDLEQFSYIISHNLRAPVANILGLTEVMQYDGITRHDEKEFIGELFSSVKKLDNVIMDLNNVLQVKNEISDQREPVKFSELLDDTLLSIASIEQNTVYEVTSDFSEIDEMVTLKTYLYSIFFNLISNSIRFRRPGVAPLVEIKSYKMDQKIALTFKDNGLGIDLARKRQHVFGLYKRFHNHIGGKGIGLFMVKAQVETLGGGITVESEVNVGTMFRIEFDQN